MIADVLPGKLDHQKGQFGEMLVGQSGTKQSPNPHGARQIYDALKTQIEEGVYGPSDKLPSTRTLASEFGASRTTITAAYEQLLAEGFIETDKDAGRGSRPRSDRPALHGQAASERQERLDYRLSDNSSSN